MEHRIVLTQKEAFELSNKLTFIQGETFNTTDKYTGTQRIRRDNDNVITEKEYPTTVSGTIFKFGGKCKLGEIENVHFEARLTDKTFRFEIEFEGEVPEEYKNRPNVHGWEILNG